MAPKPRRKAVAALPWQCQYTYKPCFERRATKRNGELHSLCEMHRNKANALQRAYAKKDRDATESESGESSSPAPAEPTHQCQYTYKPCFQPRATKRNGELHSLCEFHRTKANALQQAYAQKKRLKRLSEASPPPDEPPRVKRLCISNLLAADARAFPPAPRYLAPAPPMYLAPAPPTYRASPPSNFVSPMLRGAPGRPIVLPPLRSLPATHSFLQPPPRPPTELYAPPYDGRYDYDGQYQDHKWNDRGPQP
ncbi:hypothetical protein SPRG_13588 [Saprolegnia parasitica CBS 223.65]|uniref:Uncharacterized protein n=1 Tax=Saprolegnia parasitica (strain CBS 223.65) TaxID=695850 RepID=A0A067BS19_SAPPC|nr:hypothetical protein SPRG_13588 [Saprolegnia parasitica CBS 223.65]KDO21289.1 hypothetical protein SPRG_13588 [Saprolegnia parasitica CBS 223.65]|eukprot:XP_012208031.1 hypothetical protein SPRG_13588 [Saprolegnia parasitica CBS 223.65]